MKILLLEDDIILNEIIAEFLLEENYDVVCSFDGYEAQDLLYENRFDLLLLDVNVPNIDGFELLKDLRSKNIKTPAIFITSLNQINDLQSGFDAGADDYIKKPFELDELHLRINNIKRLYNIDDTTIITINKKIQFDTKNNQLINNGKNINLTTKEALILKYLTNNKNQPISTDELTLNIWGYNNTPTNATMRTYIKNLRNYMGEEVIATVKGVGYKINIL